MRTLLQQHSTKAAAALTTISAVCVITAWSSLAAASSPMGVYARVDSVTYEPNKDNATTVQISGVFALHKGGSGFDYSDPQPGYMYFACPAGKETDCHEQWGNLETFKGGALCAGFGQMSKSFGTVRPLGTPLSKPDTYDVGIGVQPASHAGGTCPKLLEFKSSSGSSGAGGTATPPGTGTPPPSGGGETSSSPPSSTPPPAPSSSSSNGCSMSRSQANATAGGALVFTSVGALVALAFLGRRKKQKG